MVVGLLSSRLVDYAMLSCTPLCNFKLDQEGKRHATMLNYKWLERSQGCDAIDSKIFACLG